ncbi:M48 family metalloprotease [Pseudaestuariivita atlantica]|uniref:Peptidase M48 n=1 Tax=Pseudaestuariivita atlantica TaxID=1317121 RepID=A0A0L1JUC4_9RHOB|nr:M48 family metalloprotease [Pseudaestuariivita atlantica]KNG95292.1 peptidase M48 [Pseudaestuariivita atlantica]
MHRALVRLGLAACLVAATAFAAQARGLLRDADIEYALKQVATPVLRAAGLSPSSVRILVVNDNTLNAFVADTQHIFINYGLLLKLDSAPALQAVIAHEAAHIANGHLTRRAGNLRTARTVAGLGAVLAAAAAVSGSPQAAAGLALGTAGSARRVFFGHTRAEESSADQTSIRLLVRAGIPVQGALDVMEIFAGQELLRPGRQDPYARTHPLSRDRLRALRAQAQAFEDRGKPNPAGEYWFQRAKGKLSAFTRAPGWTFRRSKESPSADIRHMREAIAYHRQSNLKKATASIDKALALRKNDPFLLELKGQIQLESRQYAAAVATYKRASALAPGEALILGGYGRALLAAKQYRAALPILERARAADFRDARILRDLSVAYARSGQNGMASLVTAERYALQGRLKDAELHAKRAVDLLPPGSGPARRAQDVLSAAKRAKRR